MANVCESAQLFLVHGKCYKNLWLLSVFQNICKYTLITTNALITNKYYSLYLLQWKFVLKYNLKQKVKIIY